MISHPLFDALVQPARTLPAHFQQAGVGMPPRLPRLLRYGPISPPQVGGSRFTGGQVAQPQTSMVHPQAAQGFTPPHYSPANPTAPSLAPFVQTQQGGLPTGPTGPPFTPAPNPTGPPPPSTDPHLTHPPSAPLGPGGPTLDHPPTQPLAPGGPTPEHPPSTPLAPPPGYHPPTTPLAPGGPTPYHPPSAPLSPVLGALLAALAGQGQRLTPTGRYYQ